MATSNAEILAQLESLAESKLSGEVLSCYSHSRSALSCRADLTDFAAILTKFKRLMKIEEAAKKLVRSRGAQSINAYLKLEAALKEPS